ncbi:MAG: bifunctional nuclease family protein [Anaerolineales bacterium]|nr:bifunctional nuclease family protein [Anaerolineales bacterium]
MSEMVEVVIDSIRVSLMSQQRVIILREVGTERYLPIMVGIYEAEHLTLALQEVEVSRPLTYELFVSSLETLGAEVVHVEVVALRDETYYGNLVINNNGTLHNIDCRPSDAINIAARLDVPIFAARQVMDEAGLIPEEDLTDVEGELQEEVDSERLSIFEDYIENLDADQSQADENEEEDGDDEPAQDDAPQSDLPDGDED